MTANGKFRVLVTDPIDREGLKVLENHRDIELLVELKPTPEKLATLVEGVNGWLVRSETKITADWIEKAGALKLIGRAGVGVDNIDLKTASRKGIAVINAPQANTIAAAEHTWGLILALSRNIPQADSQMKAGKWDRSQWMGTELAQKTLGIVGLGRIGREVAKRGIAFAMRIVAHDPYVSMEQAKSLGVELMSLEDLFKESDFITLHVPGSDKTKGLFNEATIKHLKPTARVINCARGELVPEQLIVELINSKKLRGAALDVFEKEPLAADSPLRGLSNVILTPHLGASTEEAQRKVAEELSKGVIEFVEKGLTRHAINMPGFSPEVLESMGSFLELSETLGRFLGQMIDSGLQELKCQFQGSFEPTQRHAIGVAALKGILSVIGTSVSYINAPLIAAERGIKTSETADPAAMLGFSKLLTVSAVTDAGERKVSGAILSHGEPRIVRLDDLYVDVNPRGKMIVLTNRDQPGMIGRVGELLGRHNINIADMRVGRKSPKGEAVMVALVDEDIDANAMKELSAIKGVTGVRWVKL